jgi:hypothetical protein
MSEPIAPHNAYRLHFVIDAINNKNVTKAALSQEKTNSEILKQCFQKQTMMILVIV